MKDRNKLSIADLYQRAFESALSVGSPDESFEEWAVRLEDAMRWRRIAQHAELLEIWTRQNLDN